MNKHSSYQRLRSHLAYLKLQTAAERLAPALEAAERDQPAYAELVPSEGQSNMARRRP